MFVKIIKKLASTEKGRNFVLFLMTIFRKVRTFSIFNIAYFLNPIAPSIESGFVTKAGKKGISGIALGKDRNIPVKVELRIDGQVINTTYAAQKSYYPLKYYGEFIGFYFPMRSVWVHVENKQRIEVFVGGKPISYRAGIFSKKRIPNYGCLSTKHLETDKSIIKMVKKGQLINKFGRIQLPRNINKDWSAKVISSFTLLNKMFEQKTGKQLFVFYGGLLGFARDKGIIAHDLDFDLAYYSEETDPVNVRSEFYRMAKDLAVEYVGEINFSDNKINFTKMKLSVTPVWINSNGEFSCTFAYVGDNFKVVKEDIVPVQKIEYEGYELNLPANPENIVKYIYGRGWKYPDPGWKWLTEYKTRTPIFRARLSSSQVKKLNEIAAEKNN